jgi:hypothetical protein
MSVLSCLYVCFCLLQFGSGAYLGDTAITLPLNDEDFYLSTSFLLNNKNISFLLDSGSSDTWVFDSDLCEDAYDCSNNYLGSNLGKDTGYSFQTEYFGGQSVVGELYIASEAKFGNKNLNNQFYYGYVNDTTNFITSALFGIGQSKMQSQKLYSYDNSYPSNKSYPTFLQDIGSRNTFLIDLPNNQFDISTHVNGDLTVNLNTDSHYYQINVTDVGIITNLKKNNGDLKSLYDSNDKATFKTILDTGSSVVQLPAEVVNNYAEHISSVYWDETQQSFMFESCPTTQAKTNLPYLVLTVTNRSGSQKYVKIRGQDLVVEVEDNVCALALSPSNFGVLGIPLFRSGAVGIDLDHKVMTWKGLVR